MRHISKNGLWDLPLEGLVHAVEDGIQFEWNSKKGVDTRISAIIRQGRWEGRAENLELQVDYDHSHRLLRLANRQSDLTLGPYPVALRQGKIKLNGDDGELNCLAIDADGQVTELHGTLESGSLSLYTIGAHDLHLNAKKITDGWRIDTFRLFDIQGSGEWRGDCVEVALGESAPLQLKRSDHELFFSIPAESLEETANLIERWHPLSDATKSCLCGLKSAGSVNGSLDLESRKIHLDKDAYLIFGKEYKTEAVRIAGDHIQTEVELRGRLFNANILRTPDQVQLVLADPLDPQEPLTLFFNGLSLNRVAGTLCGLDIHLVRDHERSSSARTVLYGSVDIDATKARTMLPKGLKGFIDKTHSGDGYALSGRFVLPDLDLSALSFKGSLEGRNFTFFDLRLHHLNAAFAFSPSEMKLTNLEVTDPAGRLHIPTVSGKRSRSGEWNFAIPQLTFHEVRPSLLTDPLSPKPLVITHGEIHHLVGTSSGSRSFTGLGNLSFTNPPRNDPAGTIFALPDEILGRLGLDFGCFVPSTGQVSFNIKDAKAHLTSFDEVYSRAKRSQFFLSPDADSYVGLDGQLHVDIRMRHYNLLMKITEMFTVGVRGTLQDPSYKLKRPNRTAA